MASPTAIKVALSVDGSFSVPDSSTATCMIFKSQDGRRYLWIITFMFNCNDALEAEIHVLMQGMALAIQIQHTCLSVIVQSDSSKGSIHIR